MLGQQSVYDFVNLPSTIGFVVRSGEVLQNILQNTPEIIATTLFGGRYNIAWVDESNIDIVIDRLGTSFFGSIPIVLGLVDRQNLESAGISQVHGLPLQNLRGQGTLIGFVDTGIDYTLPVFRTATGASRIQYIFDLSIRGTPPPGFVLGTEFNNAQINEALRSDDPYSIVPHVDTVGHGTFLASVAAGNEYGDFIGAAPDSDLIVVKLRTARPYFRQRYLVPPEQENVYESIAVMAGVEYIVQKALELNRPVAICLGLGTTFGTLDGFSIFTEYLNLISNINGVCLCTAAGNESQARHHTMGTIAGPGESHNIEINVGENGVDIHVSILSSAADIITISVTAPNGESTNRIPAVSGLTDTTRLIFSRSVVTVEYYFPLVTSGDQASVVKIENAIPGTWTITLYGDVILNGEYHAYLPITGLVSPNVGFAEPVPFYTVTSPATTIGSISVGAYNSADGSLAPFTSWGPIRIPADKPTLTAPGVGVGGYYPQGYGSMDGTSAAAAITTGAAAIMLQWGVVEGNDMSMSTYQIRAYLLRGCDRSEQMTYPNVFWGYGTLNLMNSFDIMRRTELF